MHNENPSGVSAPLESQGQLPGVAAVASGSQFFPVRCPRCGWTGMSNETEGGGQIADTGDYSDIVCPKCVHVGGEWNGPWIPVEEAPSANNKDDRQVR